MSTTESKLRSALLNLVKVFPTDTDMQEANWSAADIEAACHAYDSARAALALPASSGAEPVAWRTHHDVPMLFPTRAEAAEYCEDDEPPEALCVCRPSGAERNDRFAAPAAAGAAEAARWSKPDRAPGEDGFTYG